MTLATQSAYAQSPPIETTHPAFKDSLARLASGSVLWRDALAALQGTGRRAILVTPDQVRLADGQRGDRFDDSVLAEVVPIAADGDRVDLVIVIVNLALLQEQHQRQQSLPIEVDMDLDRILVHEIYGHAIPYLLAGDLSGRCADPRPGERAVDACSIERENAVRTELRLGRRVDYGVNGLNLARRQ